MFAYLRFRYRQQVRRYRRDIRILRRWAANYVNRHIWGKWHQVRVVRRFLILWWLVLAVGLVGLAQQIGDLRSMASLAVARPGGVYTEAAVGTVQVLNPVLPESTTAGDINRLIFSGLARYNSKRQLVPDLATGWDVSTDAKTYTFHLRKGVKWHDGVPFTSADVVFTLTAIQNPDSRSPLASSWQNVKAEAKGDLTVVFTLPQPLDSFMDSTTVGIVPRHLLESVEPSQLRGDKFNQQPVGTGPFKIKTFATSAREIELAANPDYYSGRPKLDEFVFKLYDSPEETVKAYAAHQVVSPGRVRPENLEAVSRLEQLTSYSFTLPEEQVLFFNTTDPVLSNKTLRSILSRSLDRKAVADAATSGQGIAATQPLLSGQTGFTSKYAPAALGRAAAASELDQAGYKAAKPGAVREKDGAKLKLSLVTLAGGELERAAKEIQRQWAPLGIDVQVQTAAATELQQTYMRPRNFQMLLYGVNLGADPDVYSYWHSSQAKDPGVNLSGYTSADADRALEAGRIKADPQVRQGKYDAFLRAWNADTPAAVLYQVGYTYGANSDAAGISAHRLTVPADRYYQVERWTVLRRFVPSR